MECRRWEEYGLLYSSNELNGKLTGEYEEHLKECQECRNELFLYRQEHARFYSASMLEVAPSAAVDAEIMRVCTDPRKRIAGPTLFASFLRKAMVPITLFVVGFGSVGYIAVNMQNADQIKAASSAKALQPVAAEMKSASSRPSDSLKDSLKNSDVNYARTRGNLSGQGVIPVDLNSNK